MGGKHATSTSKVTIPPEVLARYNAVNARAEKVAATPYEKFGTAPTDFVAQMNAQQAAGTNTINTSGGPAYEGIDKYMSPYIKNVADTTGAMMRQQQEQAQSGALGTAISSGAFGGDRAGIAAANLQQQNEMGYGKTMADIMNQGYTQALGASQADLGRKLQAGQMQIAAGTMQQQTEQAGKDAMIKQFMQEKGYPFQVAQYLANIAMGTGALSGSTTTSTQPLGIFGNLATGGRVGKEGGGGVSGPMSDSQGDIWDESYVPGGLLPVGQLMTAEVPSQDGGGGNGDAIMKLFSMGMGKAEGGGVSGRNGYAEGGGSSVLTPEQMEFLRRRQALLRDPSIDMPDTGTEKYQPSGSVQQVYGTEAPPPQLRPNAGLIGLGGVEGGARAEAALPTRPQTAGETVSSYAHPVRQLGLAAGHAALGDLAGGLGTLGAGAATGLGGIMSAAGAENYGGNYLMGLGSDLADEAAAVKAHGWKRASEEYNRPYIPSTSSLPAQPTGVVARPVLSATGDIAGGPGATAGGAGTYEVPTQGGLAPATSIIPPARPQVATGVQPPEGGASVARDTMSTLGVKASGVAPAPAATGAEDPGAVFDTKIVGQESGDNQYDRNGNPLTSPKGAVGAAQVMEATGPEAARLAGVEWDRNRWLHDKEYNKQLGKAYFLEQYRRFGSIDKAAAAYNAGPTALAQAIDRSTALGGSYLDYLPAETQNYVKNVAGVGNGATSPTGVAGPGREAPQDSGGLAAANMSGSSKPYAERGMIGQFFHDPSTGKLNPIAIKSILGGLAAMAKSNTISPISAILQGIGGGMETYNTLQNEEPKRVAEIMANSKNARSDYLTAIAMGETRPFEQWAASQYGSGPASMFGSQEGQPFAPPQLAQIDIMGNGMSQPITLPNGVVVQGGQNYAYLTKLANDLQPYVAANVPAAVATMQAVQDRLTDIRNQQGFVQDVNGQQVKDPTYTATLDAQARTGFGREQSMEFERNANKERKRVDQDLELIQHQADVFTKFPAGALATDKAAAAAVLQALGLPAPADTSLHAGLAQEALKGAAQKVLNSLGTDAPAAEMAQLQQAIESPNMEPGAIKTILSLQKAQAMRDKDYYTLRQEWNAANPDKAMDQSAYDAWFTETHGFGGYFEAAKKSMPIFAGELGSQQKPYRLSAQADENGNFPQADRDFENLPPGAYFIDPNGIIKQKPRG